MVAGYHRVRPLSEAETDVLFTLAAARLCASVCYAVKQARLAPHNEYLNISNQPAWALLETLAAYPPDWPREVFRRVCGHSAGARTSASLAAARRHALGPSLSLSYTEPLHIIRGARQYLYDASGGQAYLDCVNNVAHVGHAHPRVNAAIARQLALLNTNTRYLHEDLAEYIEHLTATLPERLSVAFLVCSGSEANELALRLARAHTKGSRLLVLDAAYHGNTSSLVEISPYKYKRKGGRWTSRARTGDALSLMSIADPIADPMPPPVMPPTSPTPRGRLPDSPPSSPNRRRAAGARSFCRPDTWRNPSPPSAPRVEFASPTKYRPASDAPARISGCSKRRAWFPIS